MIFTRHTVPNFLRALKRACSRLHEDNRFFTSTPVADARQNICTACPRYLEKSGQCGICTCFTAVKSLLAGERCPDTPPRWTEETIFSTGLK